MRIPEKLYAPILACTGFAGMFLGVAAGEYGHRKFYAEPRIAKLSENQFVLQWNAPPAKGHPDQFVRCEEVFEGKGKSYVHMQEEWVVSPGSGPLEERRFVTQVPKVEFEGNQISAQYQALVVIPSGFIGFGISFGVCLFLLSRSSDSKEKLSIHSPKIPA